MGPKTRDPGPNSQVRLETRDPKRGTRDPEIGFSANFLSFLSSLAFVNEFICFMHLCLFCMFLITISLSMYTFNLSHLLQKLPPCSCYEIFKLRTKEVIIARSHIKSSEKRFKSMGIKKLNRKKESDPQRRFKK